MKLPRIAALELLSRDPERLAAFYVAAFDCRPASIDRRDLTAAPLPLVGRGKGWGLLPPLPSRPDGNRLRTERTPIPDPSPQGGRGRGGADEGELQNVVAFDLGTQHVECLRTSADASKFYPSNSTGFQHIAIVVADMDRAMARLRAIEGWTPISTDGPEKLPPTSGGATAFKFRDPEGHPLEFLAFPADGTPPAWAAADGRLFKGIDHTAISVADTDRAIAFYQRHGFAVASRQINRGAEQERMDAVPGAVVEVTGLTIAGAPPHLELLCYREPGSVPAATADNDVLATRIVLEGAPPEGDPSTGPRWLRDPDGHRLRV